MDYDIICPQCGADNATGDLNDNIECPSCGYSTEDVDEEIPEDKDMFNNLNEFDKWEQGL